MSIKISEIYVDLDDFDTNEIIEHLSWKSSSLSQNQISRINNIIISSRNSMIEQMKMEVILQNLDKYDYLQICEIFEGKTSH